MRVCSRILCAVLLAAACLAAPPAAALVTVDWVTVGNPGNPPDTQVITCCWSSNGTSGYGSVGYVYRIATYEFTVAHYTELLNAVAWDSDPNGLYHSLMATGNPNVSMPASILRSGSAGSYIYTAVVGREDDPVPYVDFYDALRLANWLTNGQPIGIQNELTTEDGAYELLGANPDPDLVTRKTATGVFVATEAEWYKAAYYDPFDPGADAPSGVGPNPTTPTLDYWVFPMRSDTSIASIPPDTPPTAANYWNATGLNEPPHVEPPCGTESPCEPTQTGAYVNSPSPWGTFDQGGNHFEWTQTMSPDLSSQGAKQQVIRGGYFLRNWGDLRSTLRSAAPTFCNSCNGVAIRLVKLDTECSDGFDNDGDGAADLDDLGCASPASDNESPQCQDGLHNDSDGRIDFDGGVSAGVAEPTLPDVQCTSPTKDREAKAGGSACGLGGELALLLLPIQWLRRRRGRALS